MATRLLPALTAAALGAMLLAPASGQARLATSPIGQALARSPVYVNPAVRPPVPASQVRGLVALIRRRDPDRLRIAVITPGQARAWGGVRPFGNDLSISLTWHGVLLVVAGSDAYVITEYTDSGRALRPLNRSLTGHGPIAGQLRRAIAGLAAVDPDRGQRIAPTLTPTATTPASSPVEPAPRPLPVIKPEKKGNSAGDVIIGLIVIGGVLYAVVRILVALSRATRRRRTARAEPAPMQAPAAGAAPHVPTTSGTQDELWAQANRAFGRKD